MVSKSEKTFTHFIKKSSIFVVDPSSSSLRRMKKCLVEYGAKADMVHLFKTTKEALELVEKLSPDLILSEFKTKTGSGFDFFRKCHEILEKKKQLITVLLTSDMRQSTVAKAAEEDVDSFLIKPYTIKGVREHLIRVVDQKINPSEYMKKIDLGKEALFSSHYDDAIALFDEALKLSKEPSLAHFYKGQAQYLKNLTSDARDSYKDGLKVNKVHYKCQVGLFEIFFKEKRSDEAYEVIRNLCKVFPSNSDRLIQAVRLCMETKNYHDMLEYYNGYLEIDDRSEKLRKHLMAGLFIAGKYQLLKKNREGTKVYFEKVAISCEKDARFITPMIYLALDYQMDEFARNLLIRYPIGEGNGEFQILDYLCSFKQLSDYDRVSKANSLLDSFGPNLRILKKLLYSHKATGSHDLYNEVLEEATKLFSDEFKQVA